MPALTANSVTLEEILEVRAGPLREDELWALLLQSSEALHDVLVKGKARRKGLLTYTVTPESLLLCYNGKVKFSLRTVSSRNRSFTAPEIYSKRSKPIGNEGTLEKIFIYSLGMTLYHAAEYEIPVEKPVNLSVSLEGVLLSMCEESAKLRIQLSKVLEICHGHRKRKRFSALIVSMVTAVLGDDIPESNEDDESADEEIMEIEQAEYMNGWTPSANPDVASPLSLLSPPSSQISTQAQPTAEELTGSNYRRSGSPTESTLAHRRSKQPHILDKYKDHLDRVRRERSEAISTSNLSNGATDIDRMQQGQSDHSIYDQSFTSIHDVSRPNSSATAENGTLRSPLPLSDTAGLRRYRETVQKDNMPMVGYFEGSAKDLSNTHQRPELVSVSRNSTFRRYDSDASVTDSSSMVSGLPSSRLSDGRSSMVSITQGSYAPDSYITDGYESEAYMTASFGSSASRAAFRAGISNGRQFSSAMDLRKPVTSQNTFPGTDTVDNTQQGPPQRFLSVPDIHASTEPKKSTKTVSRSKKKLRTFFGPEFVQVAEDPNMSVVNISPRKAGSVPKGRRLVTVIVLNGQHLQIMVETTSTTQGLFDQVIKYLGLTEKCFFGLALEQDGEQIFLDLEVKLAKYAPPKWKEEGKVTEKFVVNFRVKFYVENVTLLSYQKTFHQFYLQLRQDILNGQLYCHEEASYLLGGLALQAETGDYNDILSDEYFLPQHYIPKRIIDKVSVDQVLQQLPQFHETFHGMTDEEAELEFIKEAQKLQEYGVHFYKVQRRPSHSISGKSKKSDRETVWIGICIRGVTVYETRGSLKFPTHRHSWPLTKKLSFKKKKFFIEPRENPTASRMTFYTDHYKKARYLLQMSQAFHRFQMKMKTKMAILDQENLSESVADIEYHVAEPPHRPSPYSRSSEHLPQQEINNNQRQKSTENAYSSNKTLQRFPGSYGSSARHDSTSDESENGSLCKVENNAVPQNWTDTSPRELSQDMDDERDVDMPYVIDSTFNSQKVERAEHKDESRDLLPAEDESNAVGVFCSPDREVCVIKFTKEPGKLLGITVLGGENSKRLDRGIYVKSVTEGGAAWRDGRLKAGDRILAVNGFSLERVTHEEAVSILKNVTSEVELKVSQSTHNYSSFDLSNIPNASSANEELDNIEVKSLNSSDEHSTLDTEAHHNVERRSQGEQHPSPFAFPSEDEPVTMISKSIPPLLVNMTSSRSRNSEEDSVRSLDTSEDLENQKPKTRSKGQVTPIEANVVQSSLLSAATSLASTAPATLYRPSSLNHSPQGSLTEDENGFVALPEKAFVVDLEKKDRSLGLSVSGGINTSVKLGGIYVKSLQLNGPADLDGRVAIGDRILAVNGISLIGVTHKQAVETIKMAPQRTRLVLDRSIPVNIPKSSIRKARPQPSDKPFAVELVKGVGGLGLSLVGGKGAGEEHGGFLRIKKMFPGQPAAASGKLQIGDIILQVNGNDMQGVTHQEAINLIRMGPQEVKLLVKREPSSIPSSLLQRSGSNASDIDPAHILADIQSKLQIDPPSLKKESFDSNGSEVPSTKPDSLDLGDETPKCQEEVVVETHVSLRSSLLSNASTKSPLSGHPGLPSRLSEPVMIVSNAHDPLETTNSLPNTMSRLSRQEAIQQTSQEDEGSSMLSPGSAPLAEDESSDVEDSRRSSSIDLIASDHSIYDEYSVKGLIERLSSVESSEEHREEDGAQESEETSLASVEPAFPSLPVLQDDVAPSPCSSDSDVSDVEEIPLSAEEKQYGKSESLTPQDEILHIELVRGSGGLGFTLLGGADTVGGCFVKEIVDGPAKESGRLQSGDQILAVNDVDISSMKHMDAVDVLRATKQDVKLKVLRRPTGLVGATQFGPVEILNLTRTTQGRLGLLIKEGDNQRIYVEDVVPGEPAATQGGLRQGDRILEINGTKVDGLGFVAARQHLDAARPVATLLVERRPRLVESKYAMTKQTDSKLVGPPSSKDVLEMNCVGSSEEEDSQGIENEKEIDNEDEEAKDEIFWMKLDKGPRGFGFSLVAAPTFNSNVQGIFIKTISPGSVAESDGRLKVGDQILKVNNEDVQGLSHAKVIGMLRKVTGTVELEIKRPSKLYNMADTVTSPPLSPPGSSAPSTRTTPERTPPLLDLDITLEDKDKTLIETANNDEDDVVELLNAISAANENVSLPTIQSKPKLHKRNTDALLSSLLENLEPPSSPPESVASADPREFDSQWESPYSDSDASPSKESTKSWRELRGSYHGRSTSEASSDRHSVDQASSKHLPLDSVTEEIAVSTNIDLSSCDDEKDDDDMNTDDDDVFDMLHDNSQLVIGMLNNSNPPPSETVIDENEGKMESRASDISLEVMDTLPDGPPPIPTTTLPSDDDEPPFKPPPRRESLPRFSENDFYQGDVDAEVHAMNGSSSRHDSHEEEQVPSDPLIDVLDGGRYTGEQLAHLISDLQEKLESNTPSEEFKALREIKPTDGCDSGKRATNKDKNRFRNVLPFEKTRVKLNRKGSNDYINASHIKVPVDDDIYHYIATQGPLPNTTHDFWQMVWEQEVVVIAMITQEQEAGKVKCHRYWPEEQPLVFERSFSVSLQRKEDFGSFIEREFEISNMQSGDTKTVFHINFITWPDHGVPKSAVELVEFVRFLRLLAEGPGPVVVHCSAGIGRTGTLITIDAALGLMERDLLVDVNKIVRNLREQRQGMIQTKDQYIFCYNACLEALQSLNAR
ncbi:tyrosine-protein phosphatase non-receptor type 13-like [Acropora palmata]|uniref:tyrosine-protein phosphatase non-receptor type 13-like n=1 Tax=Acropora palmata TaxID=6131 RepID=UPI003DA07E26